MPEIADPWAEVDRRVLDALDPTQPRTATALETDLPVKQVRAALKTLADAGRVHVHHDNARTTYTKAV